MDRLGNETVIGSCCEFQSKSYVVGTGPGIFIGDIHQPLPGVTMLHEFAHAYQALVAPNSGQLQTCYAAAMRAHLYELPLGHMGTRKLYAATNWFEYFARLSEAYIAKSNDFPHDAQDLEEHDTCGFAAMQKMWGARARGVLAEPAVAPRRSARSRWYRDSVWQALIAAKAFRDLVKAGDTHCAVTFSIERGGTAGAPTFTKSCAVDLTASIATAIAAASPFAPPPELDGDVAVMHFGFDGWRKLSP